LTAIGILKTISRLKPGSPFCVLETVAALQGAHHSPVRCHRIGQDKKVKIYRLITRNTYEREMFDRASMKLGLDHAVLTQLADATSETGGRSASADKSSEEARKLTSKEVDHLLKKGAYSILKGSYFHYFDKKVVPFE